MDKKKIYTFQIDGIPQNIRLVEALKDVFSSMTQELQYYEKPDRFAPLFKDFSTFSKGFDTSWQNMLPKIELTNAKFETTAYLTKKISDAIDVNKLKVLKNQIEESAKKYGESVKYTKDSKKLYEDYFALQEKLYANDAKKFSKALEEKKKYNEEYEEYLKISKREIKAGQEASITVIKGENDEKVAEEEIIKTTLKEYKHLEDLRTDADAAELVATRLQLKEKENLLKEHNERITALQTNMIVKETKGVFAGRGYTDVGKTRENYEQLQALRKENIKETKKEKDEITKIYDEQLAHFKKGTEGYLALQNEKQKKLADMDKQIATEQEQLLKNTTDYYNAVAQNITNMKGEFDKYYSAIGGLATSFLSLGIDSLKEDLKETQSILDKKTAAFKEHSSKVESLEKEAATATGGRAIVLQEQIAREIEARDESFKQQQELEKEKEVTQKKIDQKEKQKKKIEQAQQLATAFADQAIGVIKAWSLGPIVGPIMAAIVIASTAIQIAKMKEAWGKADKKADGGLLSGKRHSQGGMRIEGTNIEVEGDEFVVNRESTRKNMGLIDYINRSRKEITADDINAFYNRKSKPLPALNHPVMQRLYQDGGMLTNLDAAESASSNRQNDKILEAISNINIRPVVSVVEITDAQQSITSLRSAAGA